MLASDGRGRQPRMAAVLRLRPLGLFRLRLVLAFRLFLGLGAVPLWPVVPAPSAGLVLAARHGLGPLLGLLALYQRLLRVGAVAAGGLVQFWNRAYRLRPTRQFKLRFWSGEGLLPFHPHALCVRPPLAQPHANRRPCGQYL